MSIQGSLLKLKILWFLKVKLILWICSGWSFIPAILLQDSMLCICYFFVYSSLCIVLLLCQSLLKQISPHWAAWINKNVEMCFFPRWSSFPSCSTLIALKQISLFLVSCSPISVLHCFLKFLPFWNPASDHFCLQGEWRISFHVTQGLCGCSGLGPDSPFPIICEQSPCAVRPFLPPPISHCSFWLRHPTSGPSCQPLLIY